MSAGDNMVVKEAKKRRTESTFEAVKLSLPFSRPNCPETKNSDNKKHPEGNQDKPEPKEGTSNGDKEVTATGKKNIFKGNENALVKGKSQRDAKIDEDYQYALDKERFEVCEEEKSEDNQRAIRDGKSYVMEKESCVERDGKGREVTGNEEVKDGAKDKGKGPFSKSTFNDPSDSDDGLNDTLKLQMSSIRERDVDDTKSIDLENEEAEEDSEDASSQASFTDILKTNKESLRRIQYLESQEAKLTKDVINLRATVSYADKCLKEVKMDLASSQKENTELIKQNDAYKRENSKYKRILSQMSQLLQTHIGSPAITHQKISSPDSGFKSSPLAAEFKEPSTDDKGNAKPSSGIARCLFKSTPKSSFKSKSFVMSTSNAVRKLVSDEMREICSRVKKDLTGEEQLSVDEKNRVIISPSVRINKDKWNKTIKPQTRMSFFIKKLGQGIYGHDGLKERTVAKPSKKFPGKKIATPHKVDCIAACALAKLEVQNPDGKDLEEIACRSTVQHLSDKMSDESRAAAEKEAD